MVQGLRRRITRNVARKKTPSLVAPIDAIRVVPLYGHDRYHALAPAAPPILTYRNGPLISAVEVFTIFWGSGWKAAAPKAMISRLNGFFDFILTSRLID